MKNKRLRQLALITQAKPEKSQFLLVPFYSSTLALVKPENLRSVDAPPL